MTVAQFISAVKDQLSSEAQVLTDAQSENFRKALQRWSDLNLKVPGAIVVVANEEDIINTVKLASRHSIPFVTKSGGHSTWSTIDADGIVIDLSNYSEVVVDKSTKTVRIRGGVLNKQLIEALYAENLVVPLGGGNTVGSIPQALGGGVCALHKLCGNTGANILAARLVTATGDLQIVDSATPDLLWAMKGAGQFFGLTTELTLQAYPLSIIGSDDGTVWSSTYIFDVSRMREVAEVIKVMMDSEEHDSAGLSVVTTNPMSGQPCVLVMVFYFGATEKAEEFYKPIVNLKPDVAMPGRVKYTSLNDGIDPFCVKGGYKSFFLAGVEEFDPSPWGEIAQVYVDLVKECEDVKRGGYGFEWVTGKKRVDKGDSAWAHEGIKCWLENLSWYSNPESGPAIVAAEKKAVALETKHVKPEDIHSYQNFSRDTSLESRFGGKDRVERLKGLKKIWDPTGLFTKELL